MKLYTTPTSPYGRIARIVAHEKGLGASVVIVSARTREPDSPYYQRVPSGRVPYLERDDGPGLEDSGLIARYLDQFDGEPCLHLPPETSNWDYGRLDVTARSMLDGLAVLIRELRRPAAEQSPGIIAHERDRARRIAAQWEDLIAHPLMQGPLNMAQIVLVVALDVCEGRAAIDWRGADPALASPQLVHWHQRLSTLPSIVATA